MRAGGDRKGKAEGGGGGCWRCAGYPWLLSTGSILQFTRRQLAHQKLPLWSVAIKMEDGPIRNCRQEPGHLHELRLGNGAGRLLIR